jgi:hypothetical protein
MPEPTGYERSGNRDPRDTDDLKPLLDPATCFANPMAVVKDGSLSLTEKRAILSSWASDACAVEAMPSLREVHGAPCPIGFEEIMDALELLDREWRSRALGNSTKGQSDPAAGGGIHFS